MKLFTPYYNDSVYARNQELVFCLNKNIQSRLFDEIHLFASPDTAIQIPDVNGSSATKVLVHSTGQGNLTYCQVIEEIKNHQGHSCILANSDIWFDKSIMPMNENDFPKTVLALTRWEQNGEIHPNIALSQDTWVFPRDTTCLSIPDIGLRLGTYGCDNVFAYLLRGAGWEVANPCYDIKTHHMHMSNIRNYTPAYNHPLEWIRDGRVFPCRISF